MAFPVIAVGVLGGLVGAAFVTALRWLDPLIGPGRQSPGRHLLVLAGVGAAVALLTRIFGETGNVELLVDNIHVMGGDDDLRRLRALIPASLLCVASGSTMGPEAPLVQATGAIGTHFAGRLGRPVADARVLTITGMAAGFTVLFGAPLGAAFFALEILHRRGLQYYEALLPAVVGSLCGYGTYVTLTGWGLEPVWQFPDPGRLHVRDLSIAAAVGVLGAAGAGVFAAATWLLRKAAGPLPDGVRYVVGGAALGGLAWWSPFALSNGENQMGPVLTGHLGARLLLVAILAKLAGTIVVLAAGWKGGFIIPLFFLGAAGGQLLHLAFPSTNTTMVMACLMVALCVGVTKTPVGSTLVVTEMAGLTLIPAVLVAAVVAILISERVRIIESQRSRTPRTPAATHPTEP